MAPSEEAKRGFLGGEEFMVVGVQAVGTAEISPGMDSFAGSPDA
ncbi:MAG: hypothetical protein WC379_17635 [Methanoregula sp.]|jgi:hypothetical protein